MCDPEYESRLRNSPSKSSPQKGNYSDRYLSLNLPFNSSQLLLPLPPPTLISSPIHPHHLPLQLQPQPDVRLHFLHADLSLTGTELTCRMASACSQIPHPTRHRGIRGPGCKPRTWTEASTIFFVIHHHHPLTGQQGKMKKKQKKKHGGCAINVVFNVPDVDRFSD